MIIDKYQKIQCNFESRENNKDEFIKKIERELIVKEYISFESYKHENGNYRFKALVIAKYKTNEN